MTFTLVSLDQFRWISRPSGEYAASSLAVRRFCRECGTPLQWDGLEDRENANVSTATLDDSSGLTASYEIYTRSRMPGVPAVVDAKQFEAGYK